jgi:hypothetical protein
MTKQANAAKEITAPWFADVVLEAFEAKGLGGKWRDLLFAAEDAADEGDASGALALCDFAEEHGVRPDLATGTRAALARAGR